MPLRIQIRRSLPAQRVTRELLLALVCPYVLVLPAECKGQENAVSFENVGQPPQERTIDWSPTLPLAQTEARKAGKLLLVIDLPTPLTDIEPSATEEYSNASRKTPKKKTSATWPDPIASANNAFLVGSLNHDQVAQPIRANFVPVKRYVGAPSFQYATNIPAQSPHQCPVTYFCTPDLRVVHFVAGYIGADRLLTEIEWIQQTQRNISTEPQVKPDATSSNQSYDWLRLAHSDELTPKDLRFISLRTNVLRNSTTDLRPHRPEDVRSLVKAITRFRNDQYLARFEERLSILPNPSDVRNVVVDGTFPAGHLFLATLANIQLDQLRRPCYELLANGECFGPQTPRIKTLDAFLADCSNRNQAVLCIVDSKSHFSSLRAAPLRDRLDRLPQQRELLAHPKVERRLKDTEVVPLSPVELNAVLARRGERPVTIRKPGELWFALFDSQGKLSSTICSGESLVVTLARCLGELK